MKIIVFYALVLLLPYTALCQPAADSIFTVKLHMPKGQLSKKVFLAYQVDGKKTIDSALGNNRTYIFKGKTGRPQMATLVADYDDLNLQQLMAKTKQGAMVYMLKFYIHKGNIGITTADQLTHPQFTGSVINADNVQLQASLKAIEDLRLQVSRQLGADTNPKHQLIFGRRLDSLAEARRPVLKRFIDEHPDSYVALEALQEYAGSQPDMKMVRSALSRFSPQVLNTQAAKDYLQYLNNLTGLQNGVSAPDFSQQDTAGKIVRLADFKGRYVLLDFWASWCGSCRLDNPKVVQLYHDFKDRNLLSWEYRSTVLMGGATG